MERFYERAAEGDRWSLVVQLGAEELLYNNGRNGERELFYLADNLLPDELLGLPLQRAALWSGQMALLAGRERIDRGARIPHSGDAYIRRLVTQVKTLLASDLTAPERCQAGEVLGYFGDPRFRANAWSLPNDDLLGFVKIPAGPFWMGSNKRDTLAYEDEMPRRKILLPDYYIGRYPVTVAQFRAFVEASGYQPEEEDCLDGLPNHPVVNVTWYEALKYWQWLTERLRAWEETPEPLASLLCQEGWYVTLPSEAEWEKAARGADGRIYPWGNKPDSNRGNYDDTGINATSAIGCFPNGASPYDVEELSGNVWEWTRSLWGEYPDPSNTKERARRENLQAHDDQARVLRGGAFYCDLGFVRCAVRFRNDPDLRYRDFGFRVVVLPCS